MNSAAWIIVFFVWVGQVDGEDINHRTTVEAELTLRCGLAAEGSILTKWHSPVRKYRFLWEGQRVGQLVFPGWDYICVAPAPLMKPIP